ncbi:hypothetical protein [Microterricola viridarii]|uniref:Uncharacterized protein n=1 Tax=Microterricola viridarii TaxID=412690 RepID=A0A109QXL0_9MICO|nr:hypothetical protein [Microterricola viridarii]AMB58443.1 hypothetical protein AWU67_05765 [Microterricola viridarii]
MSALPDKQPLTRRQARASERARQTEASAPTEAVAPAEASAPDVAGEPNATAGQSGAHDHRSAGDSAHVEKDAAAEAAANEAAWAPPAVSAPLPEETEQETVELDLLEAMPERTLTRRELRILLAAQAAAQSAAQDQTNTGDEADSAAPESDTSHTAPVLPQPPIGHWSLDIDVEDDADDQGFDQVLSRGVGAGGVPTTTNALILPLIPQQSGDVPAPLASGEMLVTGSIDLPSLGDTGAHPHRLDSAEVDRLLDQVDDAAPSTSALPVRASKAVSTHTSTRDTLTPPKQGGVNMPTILAITAAVLALGVIGLFIGGYIFKIF